MHTRQRQANNLGGVQPTSIIRPHYLLFSAAADTAPVWQQVSLHACNEDHIPLEALGGMDGGEVHHWAFSCTRGAAAIITILITLLAMFAVFATICMQCHMLHKGLQRRHRL